MTEKKNHNIVLIGPQGSGKGTQGEMLSEYLGIPLIVTGDLFRAHIRLGTEIGELAKDKINKGLLMPDEVARAVMEEDLSKKEDQNGVILDGYPRNLHQVHDLEEMLPIDYVIYLEVPEEVTISRISSRRSCPKGHVYNVVTNPPKNEGVCDIDGEELFIREDDQPDAIRQRLDIFHEETEPVIDYYKKQDKVLTFDASGDIKEVFNNIVEKI